MYWLLFRKNCAHSAQTKWQMFSTKNYVFIFCVQFVVHYCHSFSFILTKQFARPTWLSACTLSPPPVHCAAHTKALRRQAKPGDERTWKSVFFFCEICCINLITSRRFTNTGRESHARQKLWPWTLSVLLVDSARCCCCSI